MSFAFLECRETAAPRAPTSPSSHMAGLCRGPQEAPLTGHKLRRESPRQPPGAGGGTGLTAQPLQGGPPPSLEHPSPLTAPWPPCPSPLESHFGTWMYSAPCSFGASTLADRTSSVWTTCYQEDNRRATVVPVPWHLESSGEFCTKLMVFLFPKVQWPSNQSVFLLTDNNAEVNGLKPVTKYQWDRRKLRNTERPKTMWSQGVFIRGNLKDLMRKVGNCRWGLGRETGGIPESVVTVREGRSTRRTKQ